MTAKRGSELLVKRGDGASPEVFTTVGALRTKSLTLNGNAINTTTADDVDGNDEIWNTYITGPKDFAVSGSAIIKLANKTQTQAIYNAFATGTIENYQIVVPYLGTFTVATIIDDFSFEAAYDDVVQFNLSIRANQAPTFVAEV